MYWYKRNMSDYARDTASLKMIEHGAYTLMLDFYYSTGSALPSDVSEIYRIARAFERWEQNAVDRVLAKFFTLTGSGYKQKRTEAELAKYEKAAEASRANGQMRSKQSGTCQVPDSHHILEPRTQIKEKSKECAQKPRTPAPKQPFMAPSLEMVALEMAARGIASPDQEAKLFVDYHANRNWRFNSGKGAVMVDWRKAVTTWQGNIGKFGGPNGKVSARERSVRTEAHVGAGPQAVMTEEARQKAIERSRQSVPKFREVDPKLQRLVQGVAARKGL